MSLPNLCVLVSGRGTTLDNLCQQCEDGGLQANVNCIIANRHDIAAKEVARKWDITYFTIPRSGMSIRKWSKALFGIAKFYKPDLFVLAGFDQKIHVARKYRNRILNIHPSLLPDFGGKGMYGLKVHRGVLDAGKAKTGCTVHVVTNAYDRGPVVAQDEVPVMEDDTPETLQARVQDVERKLYPKAIQEYLSTSRFS